MLDLRKLNYLAIAVAVLILAVVVCIVPDNTPKTVSTMPENELVIIIDAGHGGIDGGAVGVNGTVEKRINLEIALQLRDVLSAAGYNVIMTRETDMSIHDSNAVTINQMKVSDLRNRLELTRRYPNSILVSIHQNTLTNPSVTGAQVFYSGNHSDSAKLAQSIQNHFNEYIQISDDREIKQAGKNLFLFYNAQNVAVLAECGFLSNSEEEALLCTPEHQADIVFTIYCGLIDYLNMREEVPAFG